MMRMNHHSRTVKWRRGRRMAGLLDADSFGLVTGVCILLSVATGLCAFCMTESQGFGMPFRRAHAGTGFAFLAPGSLATSGTVGSKSTCLRQLSARTAFWRNSGGQRGESLGVRRVPALVRAFTSPFHILPLYCAGAYPFLILSQHAAIIQWQGERRRDA
jgi:hypothetical protein